MRQEQTQLRLSPHIVPQCSKLFDSTESTPKSNDEVKTDEMNIPRIDNSTMALPIIRSVTSVSKIDVNDEDVIFISDTGGAVNDDSVVLISDSSTNDVSSTSDVVSDETSKLLLDVGLSQLLPTSDESKVRR